MQGRGDDRSARVRYGQPAGAGKLRNVRITALSIAKDSGFAFGLGLDRLTNIKYGITDIRLLYENEIRFIRQFK